MAHLHLVCDVGSGDLIDIVSFCSDGCHQQWCRDNGVEYEGWYGAQETYDHRCASCKEIISFKVHNKVLTHPLDIIQSDNRRNL